MIIDYIINFLIVLIAIEHVYFMTLEMFLWQTPKALKAFGMTAEFAASTASLAANQGLYNGFLAAGMLWSLCDCNGSSSAAVKTFFLSCIAIAGIYGGKTVNKKIFFLQGVPALIALVLVLLHFYA